MQGGVGRGYTTEEYWISLANIVVSFFCSTSRPSSQISAYGTTVNIKLCKNCAQNYMYIIALSCSSNACMHYNLLCTLFMWRVLVTKYLCILIVIVHEGRTGICIQLQRKESF